MLDDLKADGAVLVVDGGDLFWRSRSLPAARKDQQLEKARLQVAAYSSSGIDVFVPGEGDFSLGAETVFELVKEGDMPVLAAGMVCGETRWPGHRVFERGGMKVGVVGVTGKGPKGCRVSDPVKSVEAAVLEQGAVDVRLVVAHVNAKQLAELGGLETVDFVLDGHARKTWMNPKRIGETGAFELGSGSRGKRLGVLSLKLEHNGVGWAPTGTPGDHHRFTHRLVDLDVSVGEHLETHKLVEAAKTRIGEAVVAPPAWVVRTTVEEGPFVGSSACLPCHPTQYAQWRTTRHSTALDTLRGVNRAADLDCYACHVTGADHPQGPAHPAEVGVLEHVGCEACHGPGKAHVAEPSAANIHKSVEVSTCQLCHDGEMDGGRFDWATYGPKVSH
ncbi:MAG: multiheme c-type cytochrome [Myxococcota bacterium]|nr:multiheme c-type cytochrome [Myxococcota bacterium]